MRATQGLAWPIQSKAIVEAWDDGDASVAAEAAARIAADATLTTAVATEATARATAVSGEATTRAAADTTNANAISAETSARIAADAGKANTSHTHAAGDITSGVLAMARLATGTPDGTQYVRDDGTLQRPSVGGVAPITLQGTFQLKVQANLGLSGLSNNDPVTTWADQSGNGLDLTSIAGTTDRPLYIADPDGDGFPCVRFDGVDDGLRKRAMSAYTGADLHLYAVVRSNERGTDRGFARLDNQSNGQSSPNNATALWKSGNHLAVYERGNGAATYAPRNAIQNAQSGADGAHAWMIFVMQWTTIGGITVLRMFDNYDRSACAPTGAGSNFAFTRVSLGAKPNDSTDAWVASNFWKADYRFFGYCHEGHNEAKIKNNMQYLANLCKVGAIL